MSRTRVLPAYINVNQFGIPTLSSNAVSVGTTQVAFDFTNHPTVGQPFRGLVVIRLNQAIPTGTTGTLPITFTSDGANTVSLVKVIGKVPVVPVGIAWLSLITTKPLNG